MLATAENAASLELYGICPGKQKLSRALLHWYSVYCPAKHGIKQQ
jgi:hypothetical protein